MDDRLLDIRDLTVTLELPGGAVDAVDRVSLGVERGETVCLVGESGCGKSLTAFAVLGLLPRRVARITSGTVSWRGQDLAGADEDALRRVRGAEIGIVFQEPQSALNPVLRVGDQVAEAARASLGLSRAEARRRAADLLAEVGIPDPEARLRAFPHELSGGMRQRVCIAIALAGEPALLIADEPTTALDVTVQAQVIELLARLQRERDMALLLITHDLALVAQLGGRVVVMYAGRVAESGPAAAIFDTPAHPYTAGLLDSLPDRQVARQIGGLGERRLTTIPGTVPAPGKAPAGCRFRDRCRFADDICRAREPSLTPTGGEAQHVVACHHPRSGATS